MSSSPPRAWAGSKRTAIFRSRFLLDNIKIQNHVIEHAWRSGVSKLLFLGSSCIYPKLAPQPLKEDYLLTGPLEPTNEWYAIAKIAGIKLCQALRRQYGAISSARCRPTCTARTTTMICKLARAARRSYGNFTRPKPDAIGVACWGTGAPLREFLYADDLARACVLSDGKIQRATNPSMSAPAKT